MGEIKKDVQDPGDPQNRVIDVGKREFIKKGLLAALAGIGVAIFSKIPFARGVEYVKPDNVVLDPVMSADHEYSGTTMIGVAGYTTAVGDLVYLASADMRWEKADANAEATTKPMLGIALAVANDGDSLLVLLKGFVRDAGFSLSNDGAPLFVSETSGAMTETAPGAGTFVRRVGSVYDASADTIHFNPSETYIEVAA